jgi:hypothetical protein
MLVSIQPRWTASPSPVIRATACWAPSGASQRVVADHDDVEAGLSRRVRLGRELRVRRVWV